MDQHLRVVRRDPQQNARNHVVCGDKVIRSTTHTLVAHLYEAELEICGGRVHLKGGRAVYKKDCRG